MPSFDVVSEVDRGELDNALLQARKEIATRFDFRDAHAELTLEKDQLTLTAVDAYKLTALLDIVLGKLARRNISLKNIERKEPEVSSIGHARQIVNIKQGIEHEVGKKIVAVIKATGLKVQSTIQDKQLRVTGKNRDDLQAVIAALKAKEFDVAINFTNFRN
jgi:cyclic-di-GMP-binding protein